MVGFACLGLGAASCGEGLAFREPDAGPDTGVVSTIDDVASGAEDRDASMSVMDAPDEDDAARAEDTAAFDSGACYPVGATMGCPAEWSLTLADQIDFCVKTELDHEANRSIGACRGFLRYTVHLFDAGPRYCLYDPITLKFAAYGAFDGKVMFEMWTCGFKREDFGDEGCAITTCEAPDGSACPDGAKLCASVMPSGIISRSCGPTGQWITTKCHSSCVFGKCVGCQTNGARDCVNDVPWVCEDGGWVDLPPCANGCVDGGC